MRHDFYDAHRHRGDRKDSAGSGRLVESVILFVVLYCVIGPIKCCAPPDIDNPSRTLQLNVQALKTRVMSLDFSDDGNRLMAARTSTRSPGLFGVFSISYSAQVYDIDWKVEQAFRNETSFPRPDGRLIKNVDSTDFINAAYCGAGRIAIASQDSVVVHESMTKDGSEPVVLIAKPECVCRLTAMSVSENSQLLVVCDDEGKVSSWDTGSWKRLWTLQLEVAAKQLAFSDDGKQLAVLLDSGVLRIWNVFPNVEETCLNITMGSIRCFAWGRGDVDLVTVDSTGDVVLRNLQESVTGIRYRTGFINAECVTVADSGEIVAIVGNKTLSLFRVAPTLKTPFEPGFNLDANWRAEISHPESHWCSIRFSPDSSFLAAGDADGIVRVWTTDELMRKLKVRPFLGKVTSEPFVVGNGWWVLLPLVVAGSQMWVIAKSGIARG